MKKRKITPLTERTPWDWDTYMYKSILNKHNKSGNLVYASDDGIRICISFGKYPIVVLHETYN